MAIQLKQNGWFPSNLAWAEADAAHGASLSDGSMAYENGNQQVLVIQVHWSDIMQATSDLLGTNGKGVTADGSGNTVYQLNRTLPMRHPVWDWLYCSRVTSYKGFSPLSKGVFPQGGFGISSTQYDFATLVCLFTQPKWRMLGDDDLDLYYPPPPRAEYQRFLQGWPQPRVEMVTAEANTLSWLETGTGVDSRTGNQLVSGGVNQVGPTLPATFPSPWPILLSKADLIKTWKRVPQNGLFSKLGAGRATNLDAALQTVNSTVIFDYPIGTLKFEGYRLTPLESPIEPAFHLFPKDQFGMPNLLFDADLVWSFFDPPYDLTSTPQGGPAFPNNTPTRGHNLGPFRGNPTGTGVYNFLWYKIGAAGGEPLMFPATDHTLIFGMLA